MSGTLWLRCAVPDGPRQARRLSEALEITRGLAGPDGHVSIEIAAGCVFCDLYYWGSQSAAYLVTALHLALGERFEHRRSFAPLRQTRPEGA